MLQIHRKVVGSLRPRPCHPHFIFNQRHVFQAANGLLLLSPGSRPRHLAVPGRKQPVGWPTFQPGVDQMAGDGPKSRRRGVAQGLARSIAAIDEKGKATPPMLRVVTRLLCHEVTRTYADGLSDTQQQTWFSTMLSKVILKSFCGVDSESDNQLAPSSFLRVDSQRGSSRRSGRIFGGSKRSMSHRRVKSKQKRSGRLAETTTAVTEEEEEEVDYTVAEDSEGLVMVSADSLMRRGK